MLCYYIYGIIASMIKTKSIFLFTALAGTMLLPSCNADSTYETSEPDYSGMAVKAFSLKADKDVLNNLDSVYFSINLMDAQIFNADSLPYGTKVSSLAMTITTDACSELKIYYKDSDGGESSIDYLTSPDEKVDFSRGDVRLHIVSFDGEYSRDYAIKVNVHQMVPDSLYWAQVNKTALPTTLRHPISQKTVKLGDKAYCLTTDGADFCMAVSDNPHANVWSKSAVTFPASAKVDVRSFAATASKLFVLTESGKLLTSGDGSSWSDTGNVWSSITAPYGDILLGVQVIDGDYYHAFFPDRNCAPEKIDGRFPLSGNAGAVEFDSKWSAAPQIVTVGGRAADGTLTGATWGFDGHSWAMLSDNLPAGEGYAVADYIVSETDTTTWRVKESHVLLAIGGRQSTTEISRDVYISRDYGMNWQKAYDELLLPEYIPNLWQADLLVFDTTLPLADNESQKSMWMEMPVRIPPYAVPQSRAIAPITSWDCPFLYLFGGMQGGNLLQPNVWRGVLNHARFRPLQ